MLTVFQSFERLPEIKQNRKSTMEIRNSKSFDWMLMEMARQHDGIQDLLGTIFSFFARKSDLYTGASSTTAKELLLETYYNYETDALEAKEKKKKEKLKRKATGFSCQKNCQKKQKHFNPKPPPAESTIHELTNNIAGNLEVEVDVKSKLKTPSTNEPFNKNNDEDGEEDTDELQMQPNSGNGCDLFYYCWTQNVSEVQEFEKDDSFSPNTSMNEPVGKNKNPMLISPVVSCVFRFLNIEDIKKFRFVCREWSKTGKVALQNRASIAFHRRKPFRRPVDFQFCLQNSASLFNSYKISGTLTKKYVPHPWTIEELTRFFDEQQKCIRELELTFFPSDKNIVKNFDISLWISKSPMAQKDTKEMTKLSISIRCSENMLDIPLHLLQHIKEITLSNCRIRLEEGIRMCPIKLKLTNVTFFENGIELDRVRINNVVDLGTCQKNRRTEELALDCKESPTKYILDLRGNTTLDSLFLNSVEIVNGEISQWAIEKVTAFYDPYPSYAQLKIKELFLWIDNSVDLLHLPNSIQKLALSDFSFIDGPIVSHCRQPIVFPNLQYLAISCLPNWKDYSFLSYFMNCPQLTHLKIEGGGKVEMKSLWITNSVKTLTLKYLMNWTEDCYFTLDTLILQTWPSTSDFIRLCEGQILAENFVIYHDWCWLEDEIAAFLKYRSSFSFCKRIYIMMTKRPKKKKFENSALKKHVDVMSSCYVFESDQKGRAISKEAFLELFPNHVSEIWP